VAKLTPGKPLTATPLQATPGAQPTPTNVPVPKVVEPMVCTSASMPPRLELMLYDTAWALAADTNSAAPTSADLRSLNELIVMSPVEVLFVRGTERPMSHTARSPSHQ
jgi:hypothetical protein